MQRERQAAADAEPKPVRKRSTPGGSAPF